MLPKSASTPSLALGNPRKHEAGQRSSAEGGRAEEEETLTTTPSLGGVMRMFWNLRRWLQNLTKTI